MHKSGCALEFNGADHQQLNRTMAGFANHPNIAACLILGLGCETAQATHLEREHNLVQLGGSGGNERSDGPLTLNIQDVGGVRRTVDRAAGILRDLLPDANNVTR